MKQRNIRLFFFTFFFLCSAVSLHAQYWGVWQKTHNITLGLSQDEKWVFFLQKNDAGITNIFKVELKTNAVTPVTNFTDRPVLGGIALFGKQPAVVYSRAASAKGDDIHLYRYNILTADPPVDFTPNDATSNKKILGLAYNGRYVYYTSDKGAGTKTDTYRYDCNQYIIELAFANDKDYETMCWSRDQTHLLLKKPSTADIYSYSIETTDKQKLFLPFHPDDLKTVFYDPMNTAYYMISNKNTLTKGDTALDLMHESVFPSGNGVISANLSLGGKYIHALTADGEKIIEIPSYHTIDMPAGANDLLISPKETSVLYVNMDAVKQKLYLFDIVKKTTKELTTIK